MPPISLYADQTVSVTLSSPEMGRSKSLRAGGRNKRRPLPRERQGSPMSGAAQHASGLLGGHSGHYLEQMAHVSGRMR